MPILAYLSNLGMGGGGTPQQKSVGGGEYGRARKRRVLIGDKQLVVTEDQLRDLLVQMADAENAAIDVKPAPVIASIPKKIAAEFKLAPNLAPIAQQQIRLNDLQTLAVVRDVVREIEMIRQMRDEEDVAILLLH